MRLNASEVGRAAAACGMLAALLLMASCGGGGEQQNSFLPARIIAFGDETSVIVDTLGNGNGSKYSVNAVVSSSDPTIVCLGNALWIQILARSYPNIVFPQCNPGPSQALDPQSRIRATFGAMAADLSTQVDAQVQESGFQSSDLVTVLVGVNDVIAQYSQYPGVPETTLNQNLQIAGSQVAAQVNRIAATGAKVIVSTIPDIGFSPFALNEKAAHIDTDRQQLIINLVSVFNTALRTTIINDGHHVGLVTMDQQVDTTVEFVGNDGFTNVTTGVCDLGRSLLTPPSSLDCTDLTLILNGNSATYLWADDRHLSPGGQNLLGTLALTRARNNPF
jgi:outer membrane lipase/esterase